MIIKGIFEKALHYNEKVSKYCLCKNYEILFTVVCGFSLPNFVKMFLHHQLERFPCQKTLKPSKNYRESNNVLVVC